MKRILSMLLSLSLATGLNVGVSANDPKGGNHVVSADVCKRQFDACVSYNALPKEFQNSHVATNVFSEFFSFSPMYDVLLFFVGFFAFYLVFGLFTCLIGTLGLENEKIGR